MGQLDLSSVKSVGNTLKVVKRKTKERKNRRDKVTPDYVSLANVHLAPRSEAQPNYGCGPERPCAIRNGGPGGFWVDC